MVYVRWRRLMIMTNILFVGNAHSAKSLYEYNKKYKSNQVNPQQTFDYAIVEGLSKNAKVTALSIPPIPTYPRSKCIYNPLKREKINENLTIVHIPILNIIILKMIIISMFTFVYIIYFNFINRKLKKQLILGYLLFYIAIPALLAKKITKNKIHIIVPDIPELLYGYDSSISKYRRYLINSTLFIYKLIEDRFDSYILITKYMNEIINKRNKPFLVIEGLIINEEIEEIGYIKNENTSKHRIVYAGTLHEKYGIKNLVNAFQLIDSKEIELHIYGNGDFSDSLKIISKNRNNIFYHGSISRNQILDIERNATLLVNPRPTSEEFTKYSFPSKILEYMISGTPVITTKILGIPKEYDDYLFYFNSDDSLTMAKDLKRIMELNIQDLIKKGIEAREFVIANKNNIKQAEKILNFIDMI